MPSTQSGLAFLPYGNAPTAVLPNHAPRKARCPSLDALVYEMRRYMKEEIRGRSCLVAGPRGSGKTTMISMAWDEVKQEFSGGCRLMLVRLHGPSLLEKPDDSSDANLSDAKLYEHVLKTIVVNLYQTAAEEVAQLFREYVAASEEMVELAAQLRLTLDGAPSAAVLRSFWKKANALPGGVLFPGRAASRIGQGAAEIVALATAAEAYRQCSGTVTKQQKNEDTAAAKKELKEALSVAGKEFSQLLMSLASGLAVGAAASASSVGIAGSTLAGVATAVASMATLGYSRTLTRESTMKEEITFLPDTKISALVHRLPLLLLRFRQAGLAPIFFIDELDKVKQLSRPLSGLASYLKFLFADQAFFCFLTDRAYLAETTRINRERSNAVQRTIFTNQLFVHYDSPSMFKFLEEVIQPVGADDIDADAQAVRYALMHRSRMLFSELLVEISSIKGSDGLLRLNPGDARKVPVHRFHLLVQLAAECVFIDQLVANRVSRDPEFAQTLYDAIFYPTNLWFAGQKQIDCGTESLVEGMSALADTALELTDSDKEFLHAQVQFHLELIASPDRLERQLRESARLGRIQLHELVMQAVAGVSPIKCISKDAYQWTYNWFGIPHNAGDVTEILNDAQLQNATEWIGRMQQALAYVAGTLSVDQVLQTTKGAMNLLAVLLDERVAAQAASEEPALIMAQK